MRRPLVATAVMATALAISPAAYAGGHPVDDMPDYGPLIAPTVLASSSSSAGFSVRFIDNTTEEGMYGLERKLPGSSDWVLMYDSVIAAVSGTGQQSAVRTPRANIPLGTSVRVVVANRAAVAYSATISCC